MPNLLVLAIGFFILPLIVGGGMLFNGLRQDHRLKERFAALHRPSAAAGSQPARPGQSLRSIAVRLVSGVGDWVLHLGLLSGRTKETVETTLRGAGHSGTGALRLFLGTKILLLLALPAVAWLLTERMEIGGFIQIIAVAGAAITGMVAPDTVVQKLRARHMDRIRDELPDGLVWGWARRSCAWRRNCAPRIAPSPSNWPRPPTRCK
jgi:tight adherence protein C